jgi:hypothetical protein
MDEPIERGIIWLFHVKNPAHRAGLLLKKKLE